MKCLNRFIFVVAVFSLFGCMASLNGVGVDTGSNAQPYFAPHSAMGEEVAVVYIFWNQANVEQYFSNRRTPKWTTSVNGKTNAQLELGSYSVVEVKPGTVRVNARRSLGMGFENLSTRDPSLSLRAEAGETYFVQAWLEEDTLGLGLRFQQMHNERDAYDFLYGTQLQPDRNEGFVY